MRLVSLVLLTVLASAPSSYAEAPYLIKDINTDPGGGSGPRVQVVAGGVTFFVAIDPATGAELWRTDGTAAGTVLVKDIYAGPNGSNPDWLTDVSGTLFFIAVSDPGTGWALWKSDGTAAGTVMVKDIDPTDGYPASFQPPSNLTNLNGTLVFTASDRLADYELWKSDGTAPGTVRIRDIQPGLDGSYPSGLANIRGTLYFSTHPSGSSEIWKSDGTTEGTVFVNGLLQPSVGGGPFTDVNGTAFFAATFTIGFTPQLWRTDGTIAGTSLLRGFIGASLTDFTELEGVLFFLNIAGGNVELWRSDGTTAGTVIVAAFDFLSWSIFSGPTLTSVDGTLFLAVARGLGEKHELWKSDGTAAGTLLVKGFDPIPQVSFPEHLTNVGGTLFFTAEDPAHGRELWRSDGTESGTLRVSDIQPGPGSSAPDFLFAGTPGLLFFGADDGVTGRELWVIGVPSVIIDDGLVLVTPGQSVQVTVEVTNRGPMPMAQAAVSVAFAAGLQGVTWTCAPTGSATCAPSGAGDVADVVDLPGGTAVTYVATGTVSPAATGTLTSAASVTLSGDLAPYSATDVDVVGSAANYHTLAPCRLLDTRIVGGLTGPTPSLRAQETRAFGLRGLCGIPETAKSLALNLTAVGAGATGHMRLFPAGQNPPPVATLNYQAGQTRGNNAIVTLDALGRCAVFVGQPPGTNVDLVVDLTGYFE